MILAARSALDGSCRTPRRWTGCTVGSSSDRTAQRRPHLSPCSGKRHHATLPPDARIKSQPFPNQSVKRKLICGFPFFLLPLHDFSPGFPFVQSLLAERGIGAGVLRARGNFSSDFSVLRSSPVAVCIAKCFGKQQDLMKFRKGVKVEVLQKAEAPFGSWRPAEIVSGNGHTYLVSYDLRPFDGGVDVERIPRKAMRPSPPSPNGLVCWVPGDILEVFDSYSWKVAEVVRLLGQEYYLVRLLGSSQELRVHAANLRTRRLWQDSKWVALPKDSARCAGGSFRSRTKGGNSGGSQLPLKEKIVLEGNMSRGMKRKSSATSAFPMQRSEVTKRFQTSQRDGRRLYLGPGDSLHLMDKVDAVDSPCLMLGEKCMHDSLNNRANGFPKTNLAVVNTNIDYQYPAVTIQDSDTDSAASSVGSCNPYGSPYRSAHPQEYDSEDICSRNDDDEASISGRESPLPVEGGLKEETHLLELHAYRATMMALYAYGSISWEQEALMTNLRLTLNISTDEHLSELRNLASSAVCSR